VRPGLKELQTKVRHLETMTQRLEKCMAEDEKKIAQMIATKKEESEKIDKP
jgi:hypothetical protein